MATVADVMTRDVRSMAPDDTLGEAAKVMDEMNVGVVPVCEGDRLVGILSIGDIAAKSPADEDDVGSSLGGISSPAEPDRSGQAPQRQHG